MTREKSRWHDGLLESYVRYLCDKADVTDDDAYHKALDLIDDYIKAHAVDTCYTEPLTKNQLAVDRETKLNQLNHTSN